MSCWGENDSELDAPAGTYQAVSAGWYHTCAIATDDTISCWGENDSELDAPAGTYKAVSAGWYHTCAIATDDTIVCWGPVPAPEGVRWLARS
ncbi:MAG: hypothetical protein F4118_05485 [Acidimicrobiaceae bacterium]|nr:hypothetical protein [Acidimicrobiaceae bacterium]